MNVIRGGGDPCIRHCRGVCSCKYASPSKDDAWDPSYYGGASSYDNSNANAEDNRESEPEIVNMLA